MCRRCLSTLFSAYNENLKFNRANADALDAGAKKLLLPSENKRDLADVPDDVLDIIQPVFYTNPTNAGIRAMGLE